MDHLNSRGRRIVSLLQLNVEDSTRTQDPEKRDEEIQDIRENRDDSFISSGEADDSDKDKHYFPNSDSSSSEDDICKPSTSNNVSRPKLSKVTTNRIGLLQEDLFLTSDDESITETTLENLQKTVRKVKNKTDTKQNGRVRVRNTDAWLCNIRKRKLAAGEQYCSKKGISTPRVGSDDFPLPAPRHVSARVHKDVSQRHEHGVSFMFVAWGQLVDHDLTLTAETKDPVTRRDPDCCHGGDVDPNCMPLEVPPHDPFYSHYHQRCLNMLRSVAGVRPGCRLGSRVQVNSLTSYIDANFVYGSSYRVADSLRTLGGGLLRSVPLFDDLGLQPLLPPKTHQPDDGCIRPTPDLYCFLAGDNRVNEQLALGVLHTMFVREHNRIAKELTKINPHWDDEKLYQETRHIVAAVVQHITFSEFLPLLLGESSLRRYGLTLNQQGYSEGYNPHVDASVPAAFATAAFRFGHSLLPRALERWSPSHQYIGARRLSAMLQQPWDLYKPGAYDQYILGMTNQLSQAMDDSITEEVTNHLFQEPAQGWGRDLAAINVARAREHGVPGFNRYRRLCRLPDMFSWSDMVHHMSNVTVTHYHEMFSHPDDVDLWSAGVAEKPQRGSMVGPTFNCLIAMTFRDLKRGDRFWYENGGWPSSFSLDQLDEIRKVRLSRLVCDNSDTVETIQLRAMEVPHFTKNPRVSCSSKALPRLNLWLWKDPQLGEDVQPTNNKETVLIEETHNLEPNENTKVDLNGVTPTETHPTEEEEEEEIKVDYHVIQVDNKPVLIESIDKLLHDLRNRNKSSQASLPFQEEETVLNIS